MVIGLLYELFVFQKNIHFFFHSNHFEVHTPAKQKIKFQVVSNLPVIDGMMKGTFSSDLRINSASMTWDVMNFLYMRRKTANKDKSNDILRKRSNPVEASV